MKMTWTCTCRECGKTWTESITETAMRAVDYDEWRQVHCPACGGQDFSMRHADVPEDVPNEMYEQHQRMAEQITLPPDWRISYQDGLYWLLRRAADGEWEPFSGPYRKRIAAARRWQRTLHRLCVICKSCVTMDDDFDLCADCAAACEVES